MQRLRYAFRPVALAAVILLISAPARASDSTSLATAFEPGSSTGKPVRVAIILDDIGYHLGRGRQAVQLPGAITLAVLPHGPHSRELAELGHRQGKEIMLHAPMSNILDKPLGPGGLKADMGYSRFMATLEEGLAAVPHVSGVNNHMGSQLTQQERPMRWLANALKSRELYLVDSRTSAESQAAHMARQAGLPSLERDYFLDNDRNVLSIAAQFRKFLAMARRTGQGVAIGHPYPETLRFLRTALPLLEKSGIELVPVSELLPSAMSTPSPSTPGHVHDHPRHYVDRIPR